ncbi:unnamed protein product [Victoria cruziana]
MAYFEFLPLHRSIGVSDSHAISKALTEREQKELLELVDVKLGHEYKLVVTTYAGLYRYRAGDVLSKNKVPDVCRKNVVLTIDSDRTDEVENQNAVKNALLNLLACISTSLLWFLLLHVYINKKDRRSSFYNAVAAQGFTVI